MPTRVVKVDQGSFTEVMGHLAGDSRSSIMQEKTEVARNFDDIVFENRNQEYGAYVLRGQYIKNLYIGVGVMLLVVLLLILSPFLSRLFDSNEADTKATPRKLVYTELSAPPPIDKPKPPPPQIRLPKLQQVIKFVPPKVVKEQVVEEVPTIEELKQTEVAAIAVEGTDVVFEEPVAEIVEEESDEIFTFVEQQPEFPGGYEAMMAFIKKNMVYPPMARRLEIDGTVHVSFLVSKDGAISEVKVLRGIHTDCDKEAIRVVKLMPHWTPGKQNGKPVRVRFIMPLKFKLS